MSQTTFRLAVFTIALSCFLCVASAAPKDVRPLEIGAAAPDFELPGVDGKTYQLADFADAKVLALVFTCNHCPTAQAYEDRLMRLHADYKDRGVALVAVSPNDPLAVRLDELGYSDLGDSLEDTKLRAKQMGFEFTYLHDGETQEMSAAYGVLATPHVFIFDAQRKLRYQGGIDDAEVGPVRVRYARDAIDALLAGQPVAVPRTRAPGCSTKWSDKRPSAAAALQRWNAEPVALGSIDVDGVKKLAANPTGDLRLINVWATSSRPSVEQLAELVTINRMYRNRKFRMYTISLDSEENRDQALELLTRNHVSSINYRYDSDDRNALAAAIDAQWRGPVPHTLLIAPGGKVLYRASEAIDPAELKKAIVEHLGRTYASR